MSRDVTYFHDSVSGTKASYKWLTEEDKVWLTCLGVRCQPPGAGTCRCLGRRGPQTSGVRVPGRERPAGSCSWGAGGRAGLRVSCQPQELDSLFATESDCRLQPDLVPPHPTMPDSAHAALTGEQQWPLCREIPEETPLGAGPGGSATNPHCGPRDPPGVEGSFLWQDRPYHRQARGGAGGIPLAQGPEGTLATLILQGPQL